MTVLAIKRPGKNGGRSIKAVNKGPLKLIHDSAWAWDLFQGPIYNRLIGKAAADYFDHVVAATIVENPMRILDVGSGAGFVSVALARAHTAATVIGIDYAPRQVLAAQRHQKKHSVPNCSFQIGNAMNLPFEDKSFDLIVCLNSIKHWPSPVQGLKEIRRVLRPRGTAFIGEADRSASPDDLLTFAEKYRAWYIWPPLMRWCLRNVVFGKSYSQTDIAAFAEKAGFDAITSQSVSGPFFLVILT